MKYHIEKGQGTYTLQRISDGVKIENLTPHESYQILYSDELGIKITEFMERINQISDGQMMFGKEVRELFTEAFRSALAPAAEKIIELESLHDVDCNCSDSSSGTDCTGSCNRSK